MFLLIHFIHTNWLILKENFKCKMTNLKTLLAITQTLMPRLKSSLNWLNFIMKNNKNIKFKNSSDISMNIQEVQKVQNPKMISTFISNTPTKRCQQLLPHNSLEKIKKIKKLSRKEQMISKLTKFLENQVLPQLCILTDLLKSHCKKIGMSLNELMRFLNSPSSNNTSKFPKCLNFLSTIINILWTIWLIGRTSKIIMLKRTEKTT